MNNRNYDLLPASGAQWPKNKSGLGDVEFHSYGGVIYIDYKLKLQGEHMRYQKHIHQLFHTLTTLMIVMLASPVLMAQNIKPSVGASLVPPWPGDAGVIPESLKNQYVFVDLSTGDLVISYPENLDDPNGSQKRIAPLRIKTNNNVEPTLKCRIARDSDGNYRYEYQIGNGPSAKQEISYFAVAFNHSTATTVNSTGVWNGMIGAPPMVTNTLHIGANGKPEKLMIWMSRPGPEGSIQPGKMAASFQATSDLKPGFTTAYFAGSRPVGVDRELPTEVMDQLTPMIRPEVNSRSLLMIGPLFSDSTSKTTIAANYHVGISMLIRGGKELSSDSPFILEVLATLSDYIKSQGVSGTANEVVPNLNFSNKPAPGLETDILNAINLAFK
ncbi:MAG: hypothetical protein J2P21_10475 [Chloracidobacterium sp.]|nr:hypothetical protein [Chloracidobacterium sp.]